MPKLPVEIEQLRLAALDGMHKRISVELSALMPGFSALPARTQYKLVDSCLEMLDVRITRNDTAFEQEAARALLDHTLFSFNRKE